MTKPILLNIPHQIETPKLILRTPQAGDGKALYKAILDGYEDCVKWICWPATPPSAEQVEEDCRIHHGKFILREDIRFLIIEKSSGIIIGRCAFPSFQLSWSVPYFGISYFIAHTYRSKGYAKEAANAMTRLAFEVLKAKKVELKVDPENIASRKIPEALNFQLEAKQRGSWPRPDKNELAELWTFSIFDPQDLPALKVIW